MEARGSPADVPVAFPVLAARRFASPPVLEERVFERVSQSEPLGGLVLQHAFNEVKQLVVLLRLRQQVPLRGKERNKKQIKRNTQTVKSGTAVRNNRYFCSL